MSCNNSHHHQPASNSAFDNRGASSSGISTTSYHLLHESLPRAATSGTSFDRSRQTPVIVAASSSSSSAYTPEHLSSTAEVSSSSSTLYSAAATTASAPYATAHTYHPSSESSTAVPSPVLQPSCSNSSSGGFICPSNFFQPYYGLSPTLSEFSVLQMCCQPLFSEVCLSKMFFFFLFFSFLCEKILEKSLVFWICSIRHSCSDVMSFAL